MHWIFTLVMLMAWTALGVKTQMSLSCSAGSRCSFPDTKVCNYTKDMIYELSNEQDTIGWYEDGLLIPRGQFKERLEFDKQRCVFILLNPSLVDTGMYTITVRYMENKESKTPKMTVNVTVFDPVTSTPFPPREASMLTGVKTQMSLSCSAGSRCSFPDTKVCNYTKDMIYELSNEQDTIGWYEDGLLIPRGQFKERLEFDKQRCVFILLNPSLVDTGMYTITVRYMENKESKTPKMTVNVTVFDPVTSTPFPPREASMLTGVKTQMSLSCSAGSRCSFPDTKVCNYTKDMIYELSNEQDTIGWYEDGLLIPRGQFKERLEFDKQRCVFILLNPSLVDTGMYTITVRYMENKESKTPKMTVNVTVFDPVTSTPFPPREASMLTACDMGFPAVLLSLAPLVNILINFFYLLPCRPSAGCQNIQKRLLLISELLSLVCQVLSIGLGLSCGISVWLGLAIFCTVLLIADLIVARFSRFKCIKTDCFCKKLKLIQRIFFFVLQLSFPGFVVIAFYPIFGEKSGQTIWLSTTFAVIYTVIFTLPYIVHTVYNFHCRPKTTKEADATEMEKMSPENGSFIN